MNKLKLGPKLIGGFVIVAAIAALIGLRGLSGLQQAKVGQDDMSKTFLPSIQSLLIISEAQTAVDSAENALLCRAASSEMRQASHQRIADAFKRADEARKIYEPLPQTADEKVVWEKFVPAWDKWKADDAAYIELVKSWESNKSDATFDKMVEQALVTNGKSFTEAENLMNEIVKINNKNVDAGDKAFDIAANATSSMMIAFIIIGSLLAIGLGLFLTMSITKPMTKMAEVAQAIAVGDINQTIDYKSSDEIGTLADAFRTMLTTLRSLIEEDGGVALNAAANNDLTARVKRDYQGAFDSMKQNINNLLLNLDDGLQQVASGAEQVATASNQIGSGSQELAQGTSEQASSLEEISSSLQEMASMIQQNAANTKEARAMAEGARTTTGKGAEAMRKLSDAVDRIKSSSDETAKIVKTIDEIAFQTNLLALNAAVEAARAGDAGKGFAVVADEVRNLAMRSAEAAKNTANMIEESVKNAENGVVINQEVIKNLDEINDQVNKVGEVMAEIAAASDQQTQGIDQINTAVTQMDQITQQNAANSEESASAAEELSSQAEEMRAMVAAYQLSKSTGSGASTVKRQPAQTHSAPAPKPKKVEKVLVGAATGGNGNGNGNGHGPISIPLDDDTLGQF